VNRELIAALLDVMETWPEDRKAFLKISYDVLKKLDPESAETWKNVCARAREVGYRTSDDEDWELLQNDLEAAFFGPDNRSD